MRKYWWIGFVEFLLITLSIVFLTRQPSPSMQHASVYKQTYDLEKRDSQESVLGENTSLLVTSTPIIWKKALDPMTPTTIPTPTPRKQSYSLILFGDSMIQTWGRDLVSFRQVLKNTYPLTEFTLNNMGKGSENVESAIDRLSHTDLPKGDIAIVGSYSYNPFVPHSISRHRDNLVRLLRKLKNSYSQVYLLVEIAPAKNLFGKGPNGVNWDENSAYTQATNIIALLESSLEVGNKEEIPIIDAFTPSQRQADKSGDLVYIDSKDHIHPSPEGQKFMAELMVKSVKLDY